VNDSNCAALWTRDHEANAAAGRPRIIADLYAGALREVHHVRLRHALELGSGARLSAGLHWLWRLATLRPEPLQCSLYAASTALRQALAEVGSAETVYIDGVRCIAAVRHLRRPGRRLVCDSHDLLSRRARLQLAVGDPPNLGYVARLAPRPLRPLRWLLAQLGALVLRYEAWSLERVERELVRLCDEVVLLSPAECAANRALVPPALQARIRCVPPAQVLVRPGAELATPLRLIFVGGENLSQNRLTLLRLFRLWAHAPAGRELHWFGRREPNGIVAPAGVVCHGFVVDLAAATYDGHSVLLNPSALAGGVKTKMLEAISHGCPALGNQAAFEGVDWPGYPLILPDDDASWASFIANPESRLDDLRRASVIGQEHLRRDHDPLVFEQRWRDLLGLPFVAGATIPAASCVQPLPLAEERKTQTL